MPRGLRGRMRQFRSFRPSSSSWLATAAKQRRSGDRNQVFRIGTMTFIRQKMSGRKGRRNLPRKNDEKECACHNVWSEQKRDRIRLGLEKKLAKNGSMKLKRLPWPRLAGQSEASSTQSMSLARD
ncbi:uncharacterized protein LOC111265271 [Varroa jacobsoni]|uniref:uncharacterized protein LOC111265271 n=1 Tax=Varroa jacobsoni TaxID=62625 RepID=UPI000BF72A35|nr:uncharacterized protein LOC111265271 [Varroa jacobsoni]